MPVGAQPLIVHLAEWEFCSPAQDCTYQVHAFDGLSGQFPLTYEGHINGRHWWTGTIAHAPEEFSFTFNNTHGWEGGPGQFNRQYHGSNHGNEIFAIGREDTAVHTSRP